MIRISYRKGRADTKCWISPLFFRSCFVTLITMFITATLAVACAFCWLRYETLSVVTIENQTGKEITTLTAVWPDGGATCVHTLLPGEKVTMTYGNSVEGGSAELLLKFRDSSQWYHARALGYLDHASGGELDAVLDNDNVHPLCCTVPKVSE